MQDKKAFTKSLRKLINHQPEQPLRFRDEQLEACTDGSRKQSQLLYDAPIRVYEGKFIQKSNDDSNPLLKRYTHIIKSKNPPGMLQRRKSALSNSDQATEKFKKRESTLSNLYQSPDEVAPKKTYSSSQILEPSLKSPTPDTTDPHENHHEDQVAPRIVKHSFKQKRFEHEIIRVDDEFYSYDPVYLRDACYCPRCIDPSTTQKLFETADISPGVRIKRQRRLEDGGVEITWKNDIVGFEDHISRFSYEFLSKSRSHKSSLRSSIDESKRSFWDRQTMMENELALDYQDYLHSPAALPAALKHLWRYGLLFVSNVPSQPDAIKNIATRIGPLRNTLYGETWDVRSVPAAKNVAYTSGNLGFHMDLLYMADPPGIQLLHCMNASTQGGESLFSDGFYAFESMKKSDLNMAGTFSKYPVTYQYKNNGHWYQYTRASVDTDGKSNFLTREYRQHEENITAINWSPPFQAPFVHHMGGWNENLPPGVTLGQYVRAAKTFKKLIEKESAVYETKMLPGTCVIFDNRRILHARRAFHGESGERWLRGAYIDTDAFKSRLRVLNEESPSTGIRDSEELDQQVTVRLDS